MAALRRLFQLLLALVCCLQLCGGHLGVLQVVAWSGMMVNFAQKDGIVQAARKTFDGEHGCGLCHAISKAREAGQKQQEKNQLPTADWSKLGKELNCTATCEAPALVLATEAVLLLPEPEAITPGVGPAPPTPPPRAA